MHAKADADVIAVRPVLDQPNVTLMVNSEVVRLQTDPSGRTVTGVVVSRDGEQETYRASIVVLAAGAANSARILLRSASDAHPAGLANGSDQVGRNYMFHNSKAAVALGKEPNETVFQKTLAINDFDLPGGRNEWPLGNIQMLGKVERHGHEGRGAASDQAGAEAQPGGSRPARGGLLAHHRRPAEAGEPGHRRLGRTGASRLHRGRND